MVLSSIAALNKVGSGGMRELNDYITLQLAASPNKAHNYRLSKPVGLHFVVVDKHFQGTNQPYISCPIQFILGDHSAQTLSCRPVWTEPRLRCKVNRKAKVGVKKYSVIRLDDYSVVAHKKAPSGYLFFIRSYQVVKKEVDKTAYESWILE
jgi:hypothetical protein